MSAKIYKFSAHFEIQQGKMTADTKQALADKFGNLKDGCYEISVTESYSYRGRYKYYFDELIPCLIKHVFGNIVNPKTGASRPPRTEEVHDRLKGLFNPRIIIDEEGNEVYVGGSTKELNDQEFLEYEQSIIAFFSKKHEKFAYDLVDRQIWIETMKYKHKQTKQKK